MKRKKKQKIDLTIVAMSMIAMMWVFVAAFVVQRETKVDISEPVQSETKQIKLIRTVPNVEVSKAVYQDDYEEQTTSVPVAYTTDATSIEISDVQTSEISETEVEASEHVIIEPEVERYIQLGYTNDDLYILSHILCGECQNCSDEMQLAVGSVFLNRINSDYFPDTFYEVAFQEGQYSCTWDGNYDREPTERNIQNAKWLLENGSIYPVNVIFQAEFTQGDGIYEQIENMYFCYID